MIKKRIAKRSSRGIYLQDKELMDTDFQPGVHFRYDIDIKNKKVKIVLCEESTNTVSKRKLKNKIKPVIDIRKKEAIAVFSNSDELEIEIYEQEIVVRGKSKQSSIIEVSFEKETLEQVVNGNVFSSFFKPKKKRKRTSPFSHILKVASYFSGAGILDLGFLHEGFEVEFALEKDLDAISTYQENIGNHIVSLDAMDPSVEYISSPIMIGGPPCKPFSNSNRVKRALDHPDSVLIKRYISLIKKNKDCKVFVLENVPQLLTAAKGQFKEEILSELKDFTISYGILNAADYGSAQIRKRAIFIGSKIGKITLPKPIVFAYRTVKQAFKGIHSLLFNQGDVSKHNKKTVERIQHVPPGGNIFNIPESIRPKGLHSDFYKRLEWNLPSITIVNPRKSMILHPSENRIISVREAARLFDLPDWFQLKGSLSSKQQQIANAVPVSLSSAIARSIKDAFTRFYEKTIFFPKQKPIGL